jgi:hypothetical protein
MLTVLYIVLASRDQCQTPGSVCDANRTTWPLGKWSVHKPARLHGTSSTLFKRRWDGYGLFVAFRVVLNYEYGAVRKRETFDILCQILLVGERTSVGLVLPV